AACFHYKTLGEDVVRGLTGEFGMTSPFLFALIQNRHWVPQFPYSLKYKKFGDEDKTMHYYLEWMDHFQDHVYQFLDFLKIYFALECQIAKQENRPPMFSEHLLVGVVKAEDTEDHKQEI